MIRSAIALAVAMAATVPALANDSSAELTTGGLVFVRNDNVEMQSEDLRISAKEIHVRYRFFNKSDKPARALFWVSPTQRLEALFNQLHNLSDVAEIVRISAEHEVNFLPPEAND